VQNNNHSLVPIKLWYIDFIDFIHRDFNDMFSLDEIRSMSCYYCRIDYKYQVPMSLLGYVIIAMVSK
jgi:hypothetical protein